MVSVTVTRSCAVGADAFAEGEAEVRLRCTAGAASGLSVTGVDIQTVDSGARKYHVSMASLPAPPDDGRIRIVTINF